MLIHNQSAFWTHASSMHSPRQVQQFRSTKSNRLSRLALAKTVWGDDITRANIYITPTDRLDRQRARFQGVNEADGNGFRFSVGENILVPKGGLLGRDAKRSLKRIGASDKAFRDILGLFENELWLVDGMLSLHVMHLADSKESEPYWALDCDRLLLAVTDAKPYYELLAPRIEGGWSQLIFLPKQVLEGMAKLAPEPKSIFLPYDTLNPLATVM